MIRPDGEVRHVEYSATARFVAGRHLAILRDIAGRKLAEEERAQLQRREQLRLRETETLLAVSRALSATRDPTETMRRVAREIALALGADMVGAYLADSARESLWPTAGYRVPPDMLDDGGFRFRSKATGQSRRRGFTGARCGPTTSPRPRVDPETFRHFAPVRPSSSIRVEIGRSAFFVIWGRRGGRSRSGKSVWSRVSAISRVSSSRTPSFIARRRMPIVPRTNSSPRCLMSCATRSERSSTPSRR